MQQWIIVKTRSDPNTITICLAWDYEFDQYQRVSRMSWPYYQKGEAATYARDLASKNRLNFSSDDPEDCFLD